MTAAAEGQSAAATRATIQRFFERLNRPRPDVAASREWVRRAVRREGAPRCPVHHGFVSYDVILRYGDALVDLFDAYPDDVVMAKPYEFPVGFRSPGLGPIHAVDVLTGTAEWIDEWGTRWGHVAGGSGASPIGVALDDWSGLDDYLRVGIPDPAAPGRLDGVLPALAAHGGRKYFVGVGTLALFERLHSVRGMEKALEDFYESPADMERLLDALEDYYLGFVRAWAQLPGVDAIRMSDDWGTQTALMISPGMWRRFFLARYRRICDEAHRHGLDVVFHSCGHVIDLIGDLIDAGIDVIDPLQPEAMDLDEVARRFGGQVAFSGGLSDQIIAGLSPRQVRDEVRRAMDTLGRPFGNAYIVSLANTMLADVPFDNIVALFQATHGE